MWDTLADWFDVNTEVTLSISFLWTKKLRV